MEYPKFKVCARCFTFNQSKYITDTMNGFTMQKTDFPFVCCIVDDASTDGEQEVIMDYVKANFDLSEGSAYYQKETDYANITYAQHKTNANCYFAVLLLKENHYSRHKPKMQYLSEWVNEVPYEALCEGDDYWVDPFKLQKQSDYLDKHPEVGMVRTNCHRLIQKTGEFKFDIFSTNPLNKIEDTFRYYMIYGPWVAPCTWMSRVECRYNLDKNLSKMKRNHKIFFLGDTVSLLSIAQVSKVYYLAESTAVYRELESSASHFLNKDRKKRHYMFWRNKNSRLFFARKYPMVFCIIVCRYWRSCIRSIIRFIKLAFGNMFRRAGLS